jgi:hypothetical protein
VIGLVGNLDNLAFLQRDGFQMRPDQVPVFQTDLVQQAIANSGACVRF